MLDSRSVVPGMEQFVISEAPDRAQTPTQVKDNMYAVMRALIGVDEPKDLYQPILPLDQQSLREAFELPALADELGFAIATKQSTLPTAEKPLPDEQSYYERSQANGHSRALSITYARTREHRIHDTILSLRYQQTDTSETLSLTDDAPTPDSLNITFHPDHTTVRLQPNSSILYSKGIFVSVNAPLEFTLGVDGSIMEKREFHKHNDRTGFRDIPAQTTSYDASGKVTGRKIFDSEGDLFKEIAYAYNEQGNESIVVTDDTYGRTVEEFRPDHTLRAKLTYFPNGIRKSVISYDIDGRMQHLQEFDTDGELVQSTQIQQADGKQTETIVDANGDLIRQWVIDEASGRQLAHTELVGSELHTVEYAPHEIITTVTTRDGQLIKQYSTPTSSVA